MNETEGSAKSTARINCTIKGNAAQALVELKTRGIIQNNREAVVQALLALQEKVVRSDIEKSKLRSLTDQRTYLKPWQEIIGTLTGIETTETDLIALLTCTFEKHIAITIQGDKPETERVQKLLGRKIAILKTDDPQKPLAIRIIPENNKYKTRPNSSVTLQNESTDHKQNALCTITEAEQHITTQQSRDKRISRDSGFAFCSVGAD